MRNSLERAVAAHYERPGLVDDIARLQPIEKAEPRDLAPVDEFHTAGRAATLKAMELFPVQAGTHVLDAGCGIGGTARMLAKEHGCRVTGIDITPDFILAARTLTRRMGLEKGCTFEVGSVLAMPFPDGTFDAALSFHVAMNVEDRPQFYSELYRTTAPGAPLCIYDVMKGPAAGMRYPVPWAETEATSFLKSRDETVALIENAGFALEAERNLTDFALDYFAQAARGAASGNEDAPALGLHLLTGDNTEAKFGNYVAALKGRQIEPVLLVARRQG